MSVNCTCAHPQSQHKAERYGCRHCDVGCSRYKADIIGAALASANTESTSAALARVTQERDYLLGVNEGLRRTVAELIKERDDARARLAELKAAIREGIR